MNELGSIGSLARRAATDSPGALAVVDGPTRWTWSDLDARVDAIAQGLFAAGVAPDTRVALLTAPSADAIAALHGIARVAAVVAPLGPGLSATELAAAAAVIDPYIVVHGPELKGAAAAIGRPMLALSDLIATAPDSASEPAPPSDPGFAAAIVLTSGTTGVPRAVVLSGAALVASAAAWLAALPPATGWLLALGLGHVAGLGIVWRAAASGVPLVVLDRPDPAEILAALARDPAPGHVSLVPIQLARLLDAAGDGPPPNTLRAVLLGGGPVPATLVTRAIKAGWPVVPTYGLSEAGSGVTALPTAEAEAHPTSAGRPLPGVQVRIAEPDSFGVGEILVDSPACFSGYLGDPTATSAALSADGWLRTGDLGFLDLDGRLTVLDRRTDRIVRGGENISPSEVEAVLLGHPAIAEAAVVARRDPAWGHLPVAAIVLGRDGSDPEDEALGLYCRRHLAAFKVPVAFVRFKELPKTSGGKLRRGDLRTILDPGYGASVRGREIERPGGVRLAYDSVGEGPIHLLLLHGALSTAGQLGGLAYALAGSGALTVHVVDRRGSGGSRLTEPAPTDVAVHVDDLVAVLDAEACQAAVLCGVSFGGVVALEFAARVPERSVAVIAWEPPYGPVADLGTRHAFARLAAATEQAHRAGGSAAAAEAFLRGVGGDVAWDRLSERARAFLAGEGDGAFVDAGLLGLDPIGLGRIRVPVMLLTGGASESFYRRIADALLERVPGARHMPLPGMTHASPITDPAPIADAFAAALVVSGVIAAGPSRADTDESGA